MLSNLVYLQYFAYTSDLELYMHCVYPFVPTVYLLCCAYTSLWMNHPIAMILLSGLDVLIDPTPM